MLCYVMLCYVMLLLLLLLLLLFSFLFDRYTPHDKLLSRSGLVKRSS